MERRTFDLAVPLGNESRYLAPAHIDVVGRVSVQGECQPQERALQDQDGMSIDKRRPPYRGIYGVLTVKSESGQAEASWMLFNSPGYESHGVSAMPLDLKTQQLEPRSLTAAGYSGC